MEEFVKDFDNATSALIVLLQDAKNHLIIEDMIQKKPDILFETVGIKTMNPDGTTSHSEYYGGMNALQLILLDHALGTVNDSVVKKASLEWNRSKDSGKKNFAFTVSKDMHQLYGLDEGKKYTAEDLLKDKKLKLDAFISDFGINNQPMIDSAMNNLALALRDI